MTGQSVTQPDREGPWFAPGDRVTTRTWKGSEYHRAGRNVFATVVEVAPIPGSKPVRQQFRAMGADWCGSGSVWNHSDEYVLAPRYVLQNLTNGAWYVNDTQTHDVAEALVDKTRAEAEAITEAWNAGKAGAADDINARFDQWQKSAHDDEDRERDDAASYVVEALGVVRDRIQALDRVNRLNVLHIVADVSRSYEIGRGPRNAPAPEAGGYQPRFSLEGASDGSWTILDTQTNQPKEILTDKDLPYADKDLSYAEALTESYNRRHKAELVSERAHASDGPARRLIELLAAVDDERDNEGNPGDILESLTDDLFQLVAELVGLP